VAEGESEGEGELHKRAKRNMHVTQFQDHTKSAKREVYSKASQALVYHKMYFTLVQ